MHWVTWVDGSGCIVWWINTGCYHADLLLGVFLSLILYSSLFSMLITQSLTIWTGSWEFDSRQCGNLYICSWCLHCHIDHSKEHGFCIFILQRCWLTALCSDTDWLRDILLDKCSTLYSVRTFDVVRFMNVCIVINLLWTKSTAFNFSRCQTLYWLKFLRRFKLYVTNILI